MFRNNIYGIALIAISAWGLLIYVVVAVGSRRAAGSWRRRYPSAAPRPEEAPAPDLTDAGQQLHAVMAASFERRRLLNWAEYRAFKIIETEIVVARRGHRVFAQTSLGEVLRSPDEKAFRSINSKRVDMLIVDRAGWPVLAIEYQGDGHYQGTAAARDAVKKEALRKAGIGYVEVHANDGAELIRSRLREELGYQPQKAFRAA